MCGRAWGRSTGSWTRTISRSARQNRNRSRIPVPRYRQHLISRNFSFSSQRFRSFSGSSPVKNFVFLTVIFPCMVQKLQCLLLTNDSAGSISYRTDASGWMSKPGWQDVMVLKHSSLAVTACAVGAVRAATWHLILVKRIWATKRSSLAAEAIILPKLQATFQWNNTHGNFVVWAGDGFCLWAVGDGRNTHGNTVFLTVIFGCVARKLQCVALTSDRYWSIACLLQASVCAWTLTGEVRIGCRRPGAFLASTQRSNW
jgi:hypothetical protein